MLQRLYINNYAIINELEIDFSSGMNVITGETGAGKSIIIGALDLILGERADTAALVNKDRKCIIEGFFKIGDNTGIKNFLTQQDLDADTELVVRREIGTNGKSRAFVNDTPVNLSQLHDLSTLLVDLHQQFDTLSIGQTNFQINVLDALAGNRKLLQEYTHHYNRWQSALKELHHLKETQSGFEKEMDYIRFQFDELETAGFKENELEEIDASLKMLSNAEGIKSAYQRACTELTDSEQPIVQQLKSLIQILSPYLVYDEKLSILIDRLRSAQIELDDISSELDSMNQRVNYNPEKIEEMNDRLSLGYKLQKKHGVQSTKELLEIQLQLEEKLQAVSTIGYKIAELEKESGDLFVQTKKLAEEISKARKKQVSTLEAKVNKNLAQVGMPNAALKVLLAIKEPSANGIDEVAYLFDANKSGQYKPVNKVASGGELSRLMLCIKSLVAEKMDMPTLIFDEIDTGISGEAAKQVGVIMKTLAANRQVICITHQPQIAGKANAHFFVYKQLSGNRITTNIKKLGNDERITAIAKMLSGEQPTPAALENAREMLQN